jgi:NitT/TauT family transport system ATP-binding protein
VNRQPDAGDRPGDQPVVELLGVSKTFGEGAGAVDALSAVDLVVRRGEFVSLIGPSGSGKSTLLRLVADLTPPTTGTVRVEGRTPAEARDAHRFAMVFQEPVLMDWRTVRENVELPLEVAGGWSPDRRRVRADALLDDLELTGFADRWPWELSGGMQQRVALARALAPEPDLLLMDEPFGALDEMTRERLNELLSALAARLDTTVLFVTHSIAEAVFLSDRVVVLSARPGRITDEVAIDLSRPRAAAARTHPRAFELITRLRAALEGVPA